MNTRIAIALMGLLVACGAQEATSTPRSNEEDCSGTPCTDAALSRGRDAGPDSGARDKQSGDIHAEAPQTDASARDTESEDAGTSDATAGSVDDGRTDRDPGAEAAPPALQGYGTESSFGGGAGAETCVVTTTADTGPGTLRDCVTNRTGPVDNPTPRTVTFDVAGTITLRSDLRIRQPYLTIDGLSAPAPGITVAKEGNGEEGETVINTWRGMGTCGHDVLVQGLRFVGVWTRDTTAHSQNAGLLSVDGEDLPGCLHHIAIWRNVYVNGQDSAGTVWGSVTDMTFAHNLVLYCYHPQSISHAPGGQAGQQRERLSLHHNLYAYSTERIPNVRGNVWDTNIEQNIMHQWAALGLGSGYALRFRCRGGGCPQRINLLDNHFTSASPAPSGAIVIEDGVDPAQIFSAGNRVPPEETDDGTGAGPFARPAHADVTRFSPDELASRMLPYVGLPSRTEEETSVFEEIRTHLNSED